MNPNDIFWLARYAHNTIAPLIKAAQQYEPTIDFRIEMVFDRKASWNPDGHELTILSHWGRAYPIMFLQDYGNTTKAQIDKVAAKVQRFIDTEQAVADFDALHDSCRATPPLEADIEA